DGVRETGQRGNPAAQALGEVEFTPHGALGHPGDNVEGSRVLREELDDLVPDQSRVSAEHDKEPGRHARCRRSGGAHRVTRSPLPTTVRPDSVTVKPRARSRSASTPTDAPASTTTSLSRIARRTVASGPTSSRSNSTESTTLAPDSTLDRKSSRLHTSYVINS